MISLRLVAVKVEMGVAMEMTKERLAEAIKVGFAQGRVDYTANINVHHIDAETFEIMVVSETSPLSVLLLGTELQ